MEPSQFLKGRTRETKITRDARGRWFNDGDPIDHPNLVRSFDAWIDRAEDGRFCLSNDINWAYIAIEGPPYFVRDIALQQDSVTLFLSGDRSETLDPGTIAQGPAGALWCAVREGKCPARFDNHAATKLAPIIVEDDSGFCLNVAGKNFTPSPTDDPMSIGAPL